MATLREWILRLWGTLRPNPRDRDLEEELKLHLELAAEDARRRSGASADAERMARIQAGGIDQTMEALRDQRGLRWLDDFVRDIRHGMRSLRQTPGFTAIALLTLALGIGANTVIFSIVNSVILRPLGYPRPEQLMYLTSEFPQIQSAHVLSTPEYAEFREMNRSFAHVGAFLTGEVNLTADGPLRVRAAAVDDPLLNALGLQPAVGRFFAAGETDATGDVSGAPTVILSHGLWQNAFGGQSVVGRIVPIEGRGHEVIGIMPPGADILDNRTEVWLPLRPDIADSLTTGYSPQGRSSHDLSVIGRLKEGVTLQQARTELDAFLEDWGRNVGTTEHVPTNRPSSAGDHTLRLQPVQDAIVGNAGRSIWLLQVAVGFVLLIACANLANLLMARAESRRREFALRAALGAGRGRLLRQTMTEGVLLSVTGGLLGLGLADWGVDALIRAYPASVPRITEIAIDLRVLCFSLGVSIVTGVLFGLAPVAQRRVSDLMTALKEGGARGTGGPGSHRIRRVLVMAEAALAVMLVIGAGLLIRTFYNLTIVDAGFDRLRMVTFSMTLPRATSDPETRAVVYERVLDKFSAEPGVQAASAMSGLPLNRELTGRTTPIENYTSPTGEPWHLVDYYEFVMAGYFQTMHIPIVAGRGFERTDIVSEGNVVVVNETLANTVWPGRNPIGQRLRPNPESGLDDTPWHTVIGVARDVKQEGVDRQTRSEVYLSIEEQAYAPPTMNVVLRTTLPPGTLSGTVQRLVKEVDPSVPIVRLRDMESVFAESIRRPRLLALLLGAFAGLALVLAAIGTYGVFSYTVAQRRREIGIRLALGATRSGVLSGIMKQGLELAIGGIAIGLAGALALNRMMASLLFGVQPTDTTTLVVAVATIAFAAAVACWLPAWRASRLDPSEVLRDE